jgi:hypothetical protein
VAPAGLRRPRACCRSRCYLRHISNVAPGLLGRVPSLRGHIRTWTPSFSSSGCGCQSQCRSALRIGTYSGEYICHAWIKNRDELKDLDDLNIPRSRYWSAGQEKRSTRRTFAPNGGGTRATPRNLWPLAVSSRAALPQGSRG